MAIAKIRKLQAVFHCHKFSDFLFICDDRRQYLPSYKYIPSGVQLFLLLITQSCCFTLNLKRTLVNLYINGTSLPSPSNYISTACLDDFTIQLLLLDLAYFPCTFGWAVQNPESLVAESTVSRDNASVRQTRFAAGPCRRWWLMTSDLGGCKPPGRAWVDLQTLGVRLSVASRDMAESGNLRQIKFFYYFCLENSQGTTQPGRQR